MWKEKNTRKLKEKHEPDTFPMIVGNLKKSIPRIRTTWSKEKIKFPASNCKSTTTTCETSGNKMRLCVNLLPVLAAAKEPMEEEEEEEEVKEEDNSWISKKKPETICKNDPSVTELVEQTLDPSDSYTGFNLETEIKRPLSPQFVLPPITQPKPASELCDHQRTTTCHTPLPAISVSEQTRTISSNFTAQGSRGDRFVRGQESDSRPWIDDPLFSRSRSAEFRLPDISLFSLSTLLQTVTVKLERKRRGGDEGAWRRVQSDHLVAAVSERLREKDNVGQQHDHCADNGNMANIEAITETSGSGCSVSRQTHLSPLSPAPKPVLILSMTKKNLTSNELQ